ncbi:MAG TPA: carbohydrate binding domain-containing protein [Bacillota bacterium]|nr:carbohydrate binding domain-containing protein [Bacillota bacterium]
MKLSPSQLFRDRFRTKTAKIVLILFLLGIITAQTIRAEVSIFTDENTFVTNAGATLVPLPSNDQAGYSLDFGNVVVTAPNAIPTTSYLGKWWTLCFDIPPLYATPLTNPTIPSAIIVANGEDDYVLQFDTPVNVVGLNIVTNYTAKETLTLKDELGNIIYQNSIDNFTKPNSTVFIGVESIIPIKSLFLDTVNGASQDEAIFKIWTAVKPSELIQNPSFDTGIDDWHCICLNNTTANTVISWDTANYDTAPGSVRVQCADNGGTYKDIQLLTSQFNLVKDTTYLLTFKAKSSAEFTIPYIKLNQASSPWSDYAGPFKGLTIVANGATDWQNYAALFTANATVSDARLTFFLGNALPDGATLNIDTISLKKTIVHQPSARELLPNPDFNSGVSNWSLYCDSSARANRYLDAVDFDTAPVSYKIQCIDSGNTLNSVQLFTMPISITVGKKYQLTFKAKSTSIFTIPSIRLMKATSPWELYASTYSGLTITNDWQSYVITFMANITADDGRITFFLGNALPDGATFWIDSLSLQEVTQ